MICPQCHANDYEIFLVEQGYKFTGPLDLATVLTIELRTDWTYAKTSADLVNTIITCRRCGSYFIKSATEATRDAYTRHTEAVRLGMDDADYMISDLAP